MLGRGGRGLAGVLGQPGGLLASRDEQRAACSTVAGNFVPVKQAAYEQALSHLFRPGPLDLISTITVL